MSSREIGYRGWERIRVLVDRVALGRSRITIPWANCTRYLREGMARRFYFPAASGVRKEIRSFIQNQFAEWIDRAVEEADRLCRHQVEILGHGEVDLGATIDWHRNPVTGQRWSVRFWADYDPVRDSSAGDPKLIFELNRHQHLPRLAKATYLTGDACYAREAVEQIESWIEQNPPGLGINWQSSLEIGIRAISWLWTLAYLLPSVSLEEPTLRRLLSSLFAQLDHVYCFPSIYSSPNTHLIGEATALFVGGVLFPEYPGAAGWRSAGTALLEREMDRQVLADGVHGELSPYYHCYALDFFLQCFLLAERNGLAFSRSFRDRLRGMFGFLMHVARPDGTLPLLGDDDGGRALALCRKDYYSAGDLLCSGAVLLKSEELKHRSGLFHEESFWLYGIDGWKAHGLLESRPPGETRASYPGAGYFIQRSDWGKRASHLVFDCGGRGILNGAHAHADALAVSLFADGRDQLLDPGTGVYNCAPKWRTFFRSTGAHNTVVIDGREQWEPAGAFGWSTHARTKILQHIPMRDFEYVEAEHDGYSRLRQGVIHRRRLLYVQSGYWAIVDDFRGTGEHQFDFWFHLSPELRMRSSIHANGGGDFGIATQAGWTGLLLHLTSIHRMSAELLCGESDPPQGWVSSSYGRKEPAPVLLARMSAPVPAAVACVLAPFSTARARPMVQRLETESPYVTACSVEQRGVRDLLVYSNQGRRVCVEQFQLTGEFFWLRSEAGILTRVLAVNASSLCEDGATLFEEPGSRPYVAMQFPEDHLYVRHLRNRQLRYR